MWKKIYRYFTKLLITTDETVTTYTKWQYIFGVVILLCSGIKLFYGLQNTMDIQFADEAAYIQFGLDLFEKMNRNWGPMYAVWYKCLSFYSSNPIDLYYLNFGILSVALAIVLYVFLIRINIKPILALYLSFCVLISNLNVEVWPRISHFCLIIFLIALIISTYLKKNSYKCITITLSCLVCTYARPEFYVSFLLMLSVTLFTIYLERKSSTKNSVVVFSISILVIIVLHLIFRFPSNDFFGYNRGVAAFYQHYAWNYQMRIDKTFEAWLNWEDLAKRTFGDCNSMWCVIKTQPEIFISNTLFNVRTYCLQFLKVLPIVFPVDLFQGNKTKKILFILIILTFIILLIKKDSRNYFLQKIKATRFNLFTAFMIIAPTILSCLIILPRDHYLFLQLIFWIIVFSSIIGYLFQFISDKLWLFAVVGILFFLATPRITSYSFLNPTTDKHTLCNKKLVHYINSRFSDNNTHQIFTNLPFVHGMLPNNFKEMNTIFDKKMNVPFTHYLDSAQYDIVIVVPSLLRDPHIRKDSTWLHFFNHYEQYNFKRENFSDCEMYLLTKNKTENQQ